MASVWYEFSQNAIIHSVQDKNIESGEGAKRMLLKSLPFVISVSK